MTFTRILPALAIGLAFASGQPSFSQSPHFACGIKIGEVSQNSAIVWARSTENETPNFDALPIFSQGLTLKKKDQIPMPADVVPGEPARMRLLWWPKAQARSKTSTDWVQVDQKTDFTNQFHLDQLSPDTHYEIRVEAAPVAGENADSETTNVLVGQFKTAPRVTQSKPIKFVVTTCQAVRSIDSGIQGHVAYQQMLRESPDFFVHTGDILYYDKAPICKTIAQARAKWGMISGYRYNKNFHQNVASYFMKDDHDTLKNDCWPGQSYGKLSFQDGLDIFREQVPMGQRTYRTFRWGKDVQIWLTENRDFRSNNKSPDGPTKTILGTEQKNWLKKTVNESNATFKFVISPGPIVGPDKKGKSDNHANHAFATEGKELREFLSTQPNLFVICGDRHWQYCSKDPQTGLLEFGCGPVNDQHSFGGDPGENPKYHQYFGARGGFLIVEVDGDQASAKWVQAGETDARSGRPKVQYQRSIKAVKK